MSILIKNALLLSGKKTDLLVEENKITKIAENIKDSAEFVIDAKNKLAISGLVNTHTHVLGSGFRGLADDLPLKTWLEEHMWPTEDRWLNEGFARKWAKLSMIEMIKSGTTAFLDLYSYQNQVGEEAEKIGMRAYLAEVVMKYATKDYPAGDAIKFNDNYLKKGNTELVTRMLGPHAIYTCSESDLIRTRELADKHKAMIHIHLAETKQEVADQVKATGKTPVQYLEKLGFLGKDVIAAHCVHVNDKDIGILAKKGVTVSHCPVSNMKLGSGIAHIPQMMKEGINVTIGTDSAASNNSLNIFNEMKTAALIQKGVSLDPTVMPVDAVFKMVTENAYNALGLNAGLREGALADIVLIDVKKANMAPRLNLLSNLVYSANGSEVNDVIINGKIVMTDRKILTVDEEKLLED